MFRSFPLELLGTGCQSWTKCFHWSICLACRFCPCEGAMSLVERCGLEDHSWHAGEVDSAGEWATANPFSTGSSHWCTPVYPSPPPFSLNPRLYVRSSFNTFNERCSSKQLPQPPMTVKEHARPLRLLLLAAAGSLATGSNAYGPCGSSPTNPQPRLQPWEKEGAVQRACMQKGGLVGCSHTQYM